MEPLTKHSLKPFQRSAIKHVGREVDTLMRDGWRVLFSSTSGDMHFVRLRNPKKGSNMSIRVYYKPILGQPHDVVIYYVRDGIVVKTEILQDKTPQHHGTTLY